MSLVWMRSLLFKEKEPIKSGGKRSGTWSLLLRAERLN